VRLGKEGRLNPDLRRFLLRLGYTRSRIGRGDLARLRAARGIVLRLRGARGWICLRGFFLFVLKFR